MWHIRISPSTKFQLKQTVLIFETKFTCKGYFRCKISKVNIIIEFNIFEIVYIPNFTSNKPSWIFGPNFLNKSISSKTKKVNITIKFCKFELVWVPNFTLTLFRMGLFGDAHGWRCQKGPLPKICDTYPTMMKLDTVIPYLKKIQKIYKLRDTTLGFCWYQHFCIGNQQFLLYQEIQI